ncbi:MAG: ABC transporter permease [Methanomassiliicoccaceae archaeon]|nr:ABC transporter permease [Methanomassiliicoccaceae archaeon]
MSDDMTQTAPAETYAGKGIGDDIRQIGVVTKYELLKHLRSRRMFIFIGLAMLLFALITVLTIVLDGKLPGDPKTFIQEYLGLVSLLMIIGVSLFCAPLIASEFEERTALLMFPRPLKKTSFFLGKMIASYIVCGGIIAIYYVVCIVLSLINTGGVYTATFGSLGMALLFMLGAGGFALLISSVFSKGSTAIIVTIAILLLIFNIIDGTLSLFNIEPVFSLTYAGIDISNIVDGISTYENYIPQLDRTITTYYPSHGLAVSIIAIWAAVTTFLSLLMFRRREF